jgi:NADH-quinone oxidoreductase subunit N
MLTAVISAFVYLRIVLTMYAPDGDAPAEDQVPLRLDAATGVALFVAAVGIVVLGVLPGSVLDFARDATMLLAR